MADTVYDVVFGDMEYRHRWIKKEEIYLLGKERKLSIVAAAYSEESICDMQRESYKYFKRDCDKISERIPGLIAEYVESHREEIEEHYDSLGEADEAIKLVMPTSILFTRDGKAIIMCNVAWDEENGIGIEVFPEYMVDIQDAFL